MPADVTSFPVEYLFSLSADMAPPQFLADTPAGTRVVVALLGGTVDGPKLKGTISPPAGDWVIVGADGTMSLDVRLTVITDDGALILMTYTGVGKGDRIRSVPRFSTGDERYAWLNSVQGVATGSVENDVVHYEVYALQ